MFQGLANTIERAGLRRGSTGFGGCLAKCLFSEKHWSWGTESGLGSNFCSAYKEEQFQKEQEIALKKIIMSCSSSRDSRSRFQAKELCTVQEASPGSAWPSLFFLPWWRQA